MAASLTFAQQQTLRAACEAARAACVNFAIDTPPVQWLSVLKTLAAAIQDIPGSNQIVIQEQVLSFADQESKREYYAARIIDDSNAHTTTKMAMLRAHHSTRDGRWDLFLARTNSGSAVSWHCACIAHLGQDWTIFASETRVPADQLSVRREEITMHSIPLDAIYWRYPRVFVDGIYSKIRLAERTPPGMEDSVCFAITRLINMIENILLGDPDPVFGGRLADHRFITVTRKGEEEKVLDGVLYELEDFMVLIVLLLPVVNGYKS